jgi:hypothetical protein
MSWVALGLDTNYALRTMPELTALARAVLEADVAEAETDSLEWKSRRDLTVKAEAFECARQVLGFGNRSVEAASASFEGCAYLLCGVSPGQLNGVTPLDPADVQNALSRYIATGQPRWTPHYVDVEGRRVLIIAVEPPRAGDWINTLQRDWERWQAGTVFVRHHGQTVQASPADIRMLELRGRAGRPRVDVQLERRDPDATIASVSWTQEQVEAWAEDERQRLVAPAREDSGPPRLGADPYGNFRVPTAQDYLDRDRRSKREYLEEVMAYLDRATSAFEAMAAELAIEHKLACVSLQLVNLTERNFTEVQATLSVPAPTQVWFSADEARTTLNAPEVPVAYGGRTLGEVNPVVLPRHVDRPLTDQIVRDGMTSRVHFAPADVRPRAAVALPDLHLWLPAELAGSGVELSWMLTSGDADGVMPGTLKVAVAQEVAELVSRRQSEAAEGQ